MLSGAGMMGGPRGEEGASTLQSEAMAFLQRRQSSTSSDSASPFTGTGRPAPVDAVGDLNSIAMSMIMQRISARSEVSRRALQREAPHVLLDQFRNPYDQSRRSSLPAVLPSPSPLTSAVPPLPIRQGSMIMPNRGANFSTESDNCSITSAALEPTAQQCRTASVSAPPQNNNVGQQPRMKDLLDVVGGMMMMSRRSSC